MRQLYALVVAVAALSFAAHAIAQQPLLPPPPPPPQQPSPAAAHRCAKRGHRQMDHGRSGVEL